MCVIVNYSERLPYEKDFAGVVFVSFSAFDRYIPKSKNSNLELLRYVGLKKENGNGNIALKSMEEISKEFEYSLNLRAYLSFLRILRLAVEVDFSFFGFDNIVFVLLHLFSFLFELIDILLNIFISI